MAKKKIMWKKRAVCCVLAGMMAMMPEGGYHKTAIAQADSAAWTRTDGVFVSSSGAVIEGAVLKGIDVSYHNKDIDWEKVKASDIDYAILRCGYGQDYESQDDVKWKEYADACVELEIPFGTYLYSYATTVSAAKSEAEHVLRVIQGYPLTYPVYYDMEDAKQEGTSAKRKAQMAQVFCSTIEAAGYQVGIYANTNWFTTKLTDSYFDSCDKWVAQYNHTCTYDGEYRMWQCTSSGKVDGISTKVDLNFWFDQEPVYQGNRGNPIEEAPQPSTGGSIDADTVIGGEQEGGADSGNDGNSDQIGDSSGDAGKTDDVPVETPSEEQPSQKEEPKEEPKEELKISQKKLSLSYGGTAVLTANQQVSWSSSDREVVSINADGEVTPKGVGTAVIMAKTSDGEIASCNVTIKKRMKDTDIAAIPDQLFTGEQIRPDVAVTDGGRTLVKGTDYKITYKDNMAKGTAVVTVKGKGYYTGKTTADFQIVKKQTLLAPVVYDIYSEDGVISLTWKKNKNASGYEIYRADDKNSTYTLIKTFKKKTKVTYSDKNLQTGKKYYYKIRAYQLAGDEKQYGKYTKISIKAG